MERKAIVAKKKEVEETFENLKSCESFLIAEYRGLSVSQVSKLRDKLREDNASFKVIKNSVIKRASEKLGYKDLDEHLVGPNAVVFSNEDPISGPRVCSEFARKNKKLVLKAGVIDGKIVSSEELKTLASLPDKEGMISMFMGVLNAPITNFARVISEVAKTKE